MGLLEVVKERRKEIATLWGDLTLGTYPAASASLFVNEKDPFRNPVGTTVRSSVPMLLDGVLGEADGEELSTALDRIVRIRAVQDFTAGQAVGFVFLLRTAVARSLGERLTSAPADEVAELGARIDALALGAFDVFTACRQRLWELRTNEAKARVHSLLRRAGAVDEELPEGVGAAVAGAPTKGGCPV